MGLLLELLLRGVQGLGNRRQPLGLRSGRGQRVLQRLPLASGFFERFFQARFQFADGRHIGLVVLLGGRQDLGQELFALGFEFSTLPLEFGRLFGLFGFFLRSLLFPSKLFLGGLAQHSF